LSKFLKPRHRERVHEIRAGLQRISAQTIEFGKLSMNAGVMNFKFRVFLFWAAWISLGTSVLLGQENQVDSNATGPQAKVPLLNPHELRFFHHAII